MSQHRSLRAKGATAAKRSVLKRFERVEGENVIAQQGGLKIWSDTLVFGSTLHVLSNSFEIRTANQVAS